jgi:hypothetical protein
LPLALVLAATLTSLGMIKALRDTPAQIAAIERLSTAIAPHVRSHGPIGCLFVFDGPTTLYRTTNSCLPSRFVYPDHLNNALERSALGVDQADEVRRILATRPGVIVTADSPVTPQNPAALRAVADALARDYRPLDSAPILDRTIRSWVRKDG